MTSRIDRGYTMRDYQKTEEWVHHIVLTLRMGNWVKNEDYAEDTDFEELGLTIGMVRDIVRFYRVPSDLVEAHPRLLTRCHITADG